MPLALMAALMPSFVPVALVTLAAFCSLAVFDMLAARPGLKLINIVLPDIVRVSKSNEGSIPVKILNREKRALNVLLGLPLPGHIQSTHELLDVHLPENAAAASITWPCVPSERGSFKITRCYFGMTSPLGLWTLRGSSTCNTELRVYPDMLKEQRRLAAIFLNRGLFGNHRHRIIGQGREFEKLRDYSPGDSYEDIHWKATAKRGKPVTKLFQVERTQEVYVLIDNSRLSARPAGTETALEHYVTASLILGLVARKQGDLFGLMTFSDKVTSFIRASSGKAHYSACLDAIYSAQSQMNSPDFEELMSFVRLRIRRRALLVILTDLGDPVHAESFLKNIALLSAQHVVLVFSIRPPGIKPLFSDADAAKTDDLYAQLGGHMIWHDLRQLGLQLQHKGVRMTLADNEKLSTELVTQYMNIKARQVL